METNNVVENGKENKLLFTPQKILKILSLLCIVLVFCPSFLVSCSGQEIEVNVMTAAGGLSMYGETVSKPYPIMLLCLVIPIAVLVMLLSKKMDAEKAAKSTLIAASADFVLWIIFKAMVKKIAKENYCDVETTGWFYLNMIALLLIIALTFLIVKKIIQMDTDLLSFLPGNRAENIACQLNSVMGQAVNMVNELVENSHENMTRTCPNCGSKLVRGSKFCSSCGTSIPEPVNVQEVADQESVAVKDCPQCGHELPTDAQFCEQCGAEIKEQK